MYTRNCIHHTISLLPPRRNRNTGPPRPRTSRFFNGTTGSKSPLHEFLTVQRSFPSSKSPPSLLLGVPSRCKQIGVLFANVPADTFPSSSEPWELAPTHPSSRDCTGGTRGAYRNQNHFCSNTHTCAQVSTPTISASCKRISQVRTAPSLAPSRSASSLLSNLKTWTFPGSVLAITVYSSQNASKSNSVILHNTLKLKLKSTTKTNG